mmetsp:Transcript_28381/g.85642  ORF Transcript_28381/g.85642 Transcript_28381/m.85642 type:complete len:80 (+) Transcript_28381:240-479(+)
MPQSQFRELESARTGRKYDQALEVVATLEHSKDGSFSCASHFSLMAMSDPELCCLRLDCSPKQLPSSRQSSATRDTELS